MTIFFDLDRLWFVESEKRRQWLDTMFDVFSICFWFVEDRVIDVLHAFARLGLNMYAFPPTTSHVSSHSNLSATHESVNTTNNNHHHHHHNNNNNNHHHHRDSSIDKESSLGESNIFPSPRKTSRERRRGRKKRIVNRPTKSHSDWIDG